MNQGKLLERKALGCGAQLGSLELHPVANLFSRLRRGLGTGWLGGAGRVVPGTAAHVGDLSHGRLSHFEVAVVDAAVALVVVVVVKAVVVLLCCGCC